MKAADYFSKYFETISKGLKSIDLAKLEQAACMVWGTHQLDKKIIIVGNGGSAAMMNDPATKSTMGLAPIIRNCRTESALITERIARGIIQALLQSCRTTFERSSPREWVKTAGTK